MGRGLIVGLAVACAAVILLLIGQRLAMRALGGGKAATAARGSTAPEESIMARSDAISQVSLDSLTILISYDNNPSVEGFVADWGFSCIVKGAEKTILFDTGASGSVFMANLAGLDVSPNEVELVVLSHAHGDHTGGIDAFLQENPNVSVYVLSSFEGGFKRMVSQYGARVIEVHGAVEICHGVYSTGELGTGIKEQGMVINTDRGAVVVTGCAHPGIVEMAERARDVAGGGVLMVIGGFHLFRLDEEGIQAVIAGLRRVGVGFVAPCHCSGDEARDLFRQAYGGRYVEVGVGKVIRGKDLLASLSRS
jgi:7,8-dihydropterin-6-yl-methyl-4-(beta-D-ribofuranosyl)aminobenzene 5'-phosphate synthase